MKKSIFAKLAIVLAISAAAAVSYANNATTGFDKEAVPTVTKAHVHKAPARVVEYQGAAAGVAASDPCDGCRGF